MESKKKLKYSRVYVHLQWGTFPLSSFRRHAGRIRVGQAGPTLFEIEGDPLEPYNLLFRQVRSDAAATLVPEQQLQQELDEQ
jgi:hypothetical protein